MFHFHKWSDWIVTERGKVVDDCDSRITIGKYITQERYCLKCRNTSIRCKKTTIRCDVSFVPEEKKTLPKHDKIGA